MNTKVKKVLFVCSLYRPHVGGIETSIEELSKYYKEKGIESIILTKRYPLDLKEEELIGDSLIYRIPNPKNEKDFYVTIDWIKRNEHKFRADIVHIIGIRRPLPIFGLMLAKLWKVPYVVTFSGGDVIDPGDNSTIKLWAEGNDTVPQSILQADWYVAFSESIKRNAIETIQQLKKEAIDVIYAGTHPQIIRSFPTFESSRPYLIAIRRLFYSKGIDLLIESFGKIHDKYLKLDLYIIGDGPEKNNLIQLVEKLNITKRVKFLGQLTHEETYPYLKGALANICPSRAEGGGNVNIEAQAASCLAIGSNAGGIPEYIEDKVTGLIFESESVPELTKTISLVLDDSNLRKKIIKQAKENIYRFDWRNISESYLSGYEKAIKNLNKRDFVHWSDFSNDLWQKLSK
jgi:glycosyltransferase involved in cell wall biosynthesis